MRFLIAAVATLAGLLAWFFLAGPRLPRGTEDAIARAIHGHPEAPFAGTPGFARNGTVHLWYQVIPSAGPPRGTILLLIAMGADSAHWPPSFIRSLTSAGYQVVLHDPRDTGLSDRGTPSGTTLLDMAADALAVQDAAGPAQAHVIGLSLGGFVAQEVAIAAPDRVLSLTLLSTGADPTDGSLPGPRTGALAWKALRGLPLLRYRLLGGEANLVRERIAKELAFLGPSAMDLDEIAQQVVAAHREGRRLNLRVLQRQQAAVASTRSRYPLLPSISAPTLVIHGTADELLPIDHARKLVELIPGARGYWLEGVGHQFPYPGMDAVMTAIFRHIDAATTRPAAPA